MIIQIGYDELHREIQLCAPLCLFVSRLCEFHRVTQRLGFAMVIHIGCDEFHREI